MKGLETESEQRGCDTLKVNSLLGETKPSSLCWYWDGDSSQKNKHMERSQDLKRNTGLTF